MKKITLFLFVLLLSWQINAQVAYNYGWEPSGLGSWVTTGTGTFGRNTTTPCEGAASARANVYYDGTNTFRSPLLGISNGGQVTFNFDYKVTQYSSNATGAPAETVKIEVQWANSLTGNWTTIGLVNSDNHLVSPTCATKSFTFSPLTGDLYVRFLSKAIGTESDLYYYYDNISVTQGAAPTCLPPTSIQASNITTISASIGWVEPSPAPTAGYQYYYSNVNVAPTGAGTASTALTAPLTGLTENTMYYVWVRSMCGTDPSNWNGPVTFRTNCLPFAIPFAEGFNSDSPSEACWKVLNANADTDAWDLNYSTTPIEGNQSAMMYTDFNGGVNDDWLISPKITLTGNEQLSFRYKAQSASEPNDFRVVLSTTGTNPADFTSVLMPLTAISNTTATKKVISLASYTGDVYIAWHVPPGGLDGYRLYIDDVIWEPLPTTPPVCLEDVNTVANEGCGNFPTTFAWSAVQGADGYKISIGTSQNGQDLVLNNVDIGNVLAYSFVGNTSTTYYYTIKPYNTFGSAINCFEDSFTTYDDGCYCANNITEDLDGNGITNVQIVDTNYTVLPVKVSDLTLNGSVEIMRGVNTVLNVTLATGFSYWTNVWIDFNDNYSFEPSELVHVATESSNVIPTIYNSSFITPLTAALGEHRMRIVTTDDPQNPANPCFSGAYGVVVDLLVNILEAPACLPPSASSTSMITATTATLNWVSPATTFNVEIVFANESQGSGIITNGISGNTTTVNNLDPQQDYAYYIQTDCGSGSLSPWTGPFTFRTGCAAFGDFTEDFTTDVSYTVPECFKSLIVSTLSSPSINVYNYNDYVSMNNSGNAAAELYFISPAVEALPLMTHRMKFKAFSYTTGVSVIVGTMSDPSQASTFTPMQTIPVTSAFANYSVTFNQATTDMYVAFKFVGTGTYQTLYIDNLVWETAPLCADINIVTFDGATSSSANISWVPGASETAWQYVYGSAETTDPSGLTPVDVTSGPSTTIPGLLPSTTYKVWVRSSCGTSFGTYSEPITFTTACVAVTEYPWTEGFENITPGFEVFPNCWDEENGDYSTSSDITYNTPRTGSKYLRNSWSATNEFMWTPGFALTAGVSYDFSFYMQGDGFTGWTVDVFHNTVQNSTGATQIGAPTTASGTGSYVIQPYALVSNTFVPTTDGTYYFAVRVNQPSGSPWYIAFDDFRMEPTPSCIAPMAPTVTDVTIATATMNWGATTPAPANGYDYFITTATVAPNATTVPTGTVAAGVTTASLTSLSSSTVYRTYVRSICGTNDFSSWSDAGMFTTPCAGYNAPFLQDFTTYVPLCWSTAAAGTVATGPTGSAAGIWVVDGFLNVGATGAVKVNLYSTNRIGWLITPSMNTTVGEAYTLSFDYGVTEWNDTVESAMGSDDFVKIAMTTDNGLTWTEVQSITAANNVSNISQQFTHQFTATTVQVKFALIASDGVVSDDLDYDFFVDNLAFVSTLSNVDFNNISFTAYPNPVKDVLNVSFNQNISDIVVYNLLGQQVLFMNLNANKGQLDMSNLVSGTYLVKVNSENGVKTIKVIKE